MTRWQPIKSFLVRIERNSCNKLKVHYLQSKKQFLDGGGGVGGVSLRFSNVHEISRIFLKKFSFIAEIFLKLLTPENVANKCSKTPGSEQPSSVKVLSGPKHF